MLSESGLLRLWSEIYRLTNDLTPLHEDCGQLCQSLCCQDWEPGVGLYLLPGEQLLLADAKWLTRRWHSAKHYDFPPSYGAGAWFVTCDGHCPRDWRPFSCRTFPLTPHLDQNARLQLILDEKGMPICPLIQIQAPERLQARFRHGMHRAWRKLLGIPAIRADVVTASEKRRRKTRGATHFL